MIKYTKREKATIDRAAAIINYRWTIAENKPSVLSSPECTIEFIRPRLANRKAEVFCVTFLNSQHKVIAVENLFFGTLDGAAIYPREVARRCLELGAAAVILAHNHPSGMAEPSAADRRITERLTSALALLDIRVLDHLIVGGGLTYYSFAEHGAI